MKLGHQVLVFPAWRDNPFLNLLELNARAAGYQFLRSTSYSGLIEQIARLLPNDIVHVHWTTPIVQAAGSEDEAVERVAEFERILTEAKSRGVRVIWTLHNRLPHELAYREAEIALYRVLESASDAVHVMSPQSAEVVADVVRLSPEKTRVIAHPSYAGVYDSGITRAQARNSFALEDSDVGVLFLGQIRPYKGVDALVAGAGLARRDDGRELALMLAGAVKDVPLEEFLATLRPDLKRVTEFGFVPDGDLARWFTAADIAVFPYRAILNSGSLHLAATFHVPVLLPGESHLREQFAGQPWIAYFDIDRPAESIAELLSDADLFAGVTDADFDAFTREISPWRVARMYRELLDEVSGGALTASLAS
ncbi:glycosyltransferase [Leucobacter japonicus]|uniref:glycosyltransferase n=1 Tax=Leucobacter japonicus TaxID=1461259 RepID=UPI0006A7C782|nr:glycosyltransferase [Leucobacter japonicus]